MVLATACFLLLAACGSSLSPGAFAQNSMATATATATAAAGGRGRPSLRDNDFFPEEVQRGPFAPEDFTLAFGAPVASPGGTFRAANLASAQVLGAMGRGIAHTIVDIAPCGLVIPHVHPRGEESILVIDGALDAAFASETGELVRNDALQPDDIFAIPQGVLHYVSNPSCAPARFVASFPTADAGGIGALPSVFAFPDNVIAGALPTATAPMIQAFRAALAEEGLLVVDPVCAERCGI